MKFKKGEKVLINIVPGPDSIFECPEMHGRSALVLKDQVESRYVAIMLTDGPWKDQIKHLHQAHLILVDEKEVA